MSADRHKPRVKPAPLHVPGAAWWDQTKAIGARLGRTFFASGLDRLEHDFSIELRAEARVTVAKQTLLDLAKQAATEKWSPGEISDDALQLRAHGCILRHASIAHIASQFLDRAGLVRTPYFFYSARLKLEEWNNASYHSRPYRDSAKGMHRFVFGRPLEPVEVYSNASFQRALGRVMMIAADLPDPSLEQAHALLHEFDRALIAERDGRPLPGDGDYRGLGSWAVDQMYERGGQGFESAQSVDPEPGPSPSLDAEPDAWIALAAMEETDLQRSRAQWIIRTVYPKLTKQQRKACRLVCACGLRNVRAAEVMEIAPNNIGRLLSDVRNAFAAQASKFDPGSRPDVSDALSGLLTPEEFDSLVNQICEGRL